MYSTEDYFNKPRWVVTYEIHKYLVDQGIPLPDGESLAEDRVRGMEVCPEYFGEFPVPVETPWGPILQYDKLWNGIYWLETAEAGWALALAFPFLRMFGKILRPWQFPPQAPWKAEKTVTLPTTSIHTGRAVCLFLNC